MKTFWLTPYVDRAYSANGSHDDDEGDVLQVDFSGKLANELLKREREIEWVSELIRDSIREIVAQRATRKHKISSKKDDPLPSHRTKNRVPIDEVVDVISMPQFDSKSADAAAYAVRIPDNVSRLIREYVSIISAAYRKNAFHNFEHACKYTDIRLWHCIRSIMVSYSMLLLYFRPRDHVLLQIFEAHCVSRLE